MFDLNAYKASISETADIAITTAAGEPTDIVIKVLYPESDAARKTSLRLRNQSLKFRQKNNGLETAERIDANYIEYLAHLTVGWEGLSLDGAPYPFSVENAKKLYAEYSFIRNQVDDFVGDIKNFIRP